MLEPITPDKIDFSESLGGWLIISLGESSIPKAKAGRESVTRFINKICVGNKNVLFGSRSDVMRIPKTSTMFVDNRNKIVFSMFWCRREDGSHRRIAGSE